MRFVLLLTVVLLLISYPWLAFPNPARITTTGSNVVLSNDEIEITYDLSTGLWSFSSVTPQVNLKNLSTVVKIVSNGSVYSVSFPETIWSSDNNKFSSRTYQSNRLADSLGEGYELKITCTRIPSAGTPQPWVDIWQSFKLYDDENFVVIQNGVVNRFRSGGFDYISTITSSSGTDYYAELEFGDSGDSIKVLSLGPTNYLNTRYGVKKLSSETLDSWWIMGIRNEVDGSGIVLGPLTASKTEQRIFLAPGMDNGPLGLRVTNYLYSDRIYPRIGGSTVYSNGTYDIVPGRTLITRRGEEIVTDPMVILCSESIFDGLEEYGDKVRVFNDLQPWLNPVIGWFAAYSTFPDHVRGPTLPHTTELRRGIQLAKDLLGDYGMKYILLNIPPYFSEDGVPWWNPLPVFGWQNHTYSDVKNISDFIRGLGFKPGAIQHAPYFYTDIADPECREPFITALNRAHNEWGFDYLYPDVGIPEFFDSNQKSTHMEEIANLYEAYREGMGEDSFINANWVCWAPLIGKVEGCRVAADSLGGHYVFGLRGLATRYFMHNKFWLNDPEYFDPSATPWYGSGTRTATLDETRAYASILGIYGSQLFVGHLLGLAPERIDILRKIMPVFLSPDGRCVRPLDLFDYDYQANTHGGPGVWHLRVNKDFGSWDLLVLANFDDSRRNYSVPLSDLGLQGKKVLVYDFWNSRYVGVEDDSICAGIDGHSGVLYSLHENLRRPQLISTDRHVTQGAIEIQDLKWNADQKRLSGISSGILGTTQHVKIYIPPTYEVLSTSHSFVMESPRILSMALGFSESDTIDWFIDSKEIKSNSVQTY